MNVTYVLEPTWLRRNSMYIRIYILWMNLIFNILGPFLLLATLNHIVYKKIKQFESRLTEGLGICLTANSRRHRNPGETNGAERHLHAPLVQNPSHRTEETGRRTHNSGMKEH